MCNANAFRTLYADEIEVRVQQLKEYSGKVSAPLLLYKNARVDMDMLDERFGCLGWQREHSFKEGKNYCKVSVFDADKQMWISKEDVGVESNTEETKGEASDSFKRACVNFGIGRELYTAPNISIELTDGDYYSKGNSKFALNVWTKFRVQEITYNKERRIESLTIVDQRGRVRFSFGNTSQQTAQVAKPAKKELTMDKIMDEAFLKKLVDWLHKNRNGMKIEDCISYYYEADHETKDCVIKEYIRIYGNK